MVTSSPAADVHDLGRAVVLAQEDARVGEIVDVEELPPRRPGAPDRHARSAREPRAVDLADQRGEDVGGVEVEVVVRAVEVGRHAGDEVAAVLGRVGLAEADAGDLGERVGVVRRLERAGEKRVLADRLVGELRVDAGAAEERRLADPHS